MLQTLKLLLPALVPSWRFFDGVAPSPRIEFALLEAKEGGSVVWQEFRPRPQNLSFFDMCKRMVWNPRWNESLFLVSCAERLMENFTEHSYQEILTRIKTELERSGVDCVSAPYLQFRLVFLSRKCGEVRKKISFISSRHSFFESAAL